MYIASWEQKHNIEFQGKNYLYIRSLKKIYKKLSNLPIRSNMKYKNHKTL